MNETTSESPVEPDLQKLEGREIAGRYLLKRCLDQGAFGVVYQAAQLAYGVVLRDVAIKIAKRPMSDAEAHKTFGDALLLTKLVDGTSDASLRQHFVAVHDAGRFEEPPVKGHPYLVMELVRGGSVASCLKAGPFPLKRAKSYFDQILKAVGYMHSHKIAHRDIKPANVLVDRSENAADVVKVSDFGLAVEVDSLLGWTQSAGDLAYFAPESFSHNISSPQSDVYMLSLVFYEMLTGENPFARIGVHLRGSQSENQAELRRIHLIARQREKFALLESHPEMQPFPELAHVIRQGLAASMDSRPFRSAIEFHSAWKQAQDAPPKRTVGPKPWDAVRQWTSEAEQCYQVGEFQRGDELLEQAMTANRSLPPPMVIGKTYLLATERLIAKGQPEEAGRVALEGQKRKSCRSTCLAVASYMKLENRNLALRYEDDAKNCKDQT